MESKYSALDADKSQVIVLESVVQIYLGWLKILMILIIMAKNTRCQPENIPSVAPLNDMSDSPVLQARCPRNLTSLIELWDNGLFRRH